MKTHNPRLATCEQQSLRLNLSLRLQLANEGRKWMLAGRPGWPWLGLVSACLLVQPAAALAADPSERLLRHTWESDPDLGPVWDRGYPRPAFRPDIERLQSGINEYVLAESRRIVQSFARIEPEDYDATRDALLELLQEAQGDRLLRLAVLSAWCQLYDENQAGTVWECVQADASLRDFFESVLIEKGSGVAQAVWLARLEAATESPHRLQRAAEGVAVCQATAAVPPLQALLDSERWPASVHLTVSRALGQLASEDLEAVAKDWRASSRPLRELIAANLLNEHKSDAAEQVMSEVLRCGQAPAETVAYDWFARARPQQARELAQELITHADSSLRLTVAEVLHSQDDEDSLRLQAILMDDPSTSVRQQVREYLIAKAQQNEQLRAVVVELLDAMLAGVRPRATEQAILVAVALDEQPCCAQLVSLLDHPHSEVSISAAWALQQLAEETPLLADILEHCQHWTARLQAADPQKPVSDEDVYRLSFLFGALGRNAYRPADSMLREYVPKNEQRMRPTTRIAAIWALGHLWENQLDTELEKPLAQRLLDASPTDPEEDAVRYTATLTLGRLGNPVSLEALERAPFDEPEAVGMAITWALKQIQTKQQARQQ